MKLVRYGKSGKEKPGLIDGAGKLRDLSEIVADIDAATLGPRALARLAKIKPDFASRRARRAAPRTVRRRRRQLHRRRAQLCRPRRRVRHAGPEGADPVQQGAVLHRRPQRRRRHPEGIEEDRLGSRARGRDRQRGRAMSAKRGALPCRGLLRLQRRVRTRVSARALGTVDEGQELPRPSVRSVRGW